MTSTQADFLALMKSLRAKQEANKPKVEKKKKEPDMVSLLSETAFKGKSVVFGGGTLKHYSRKEGCKLVNELGGYIQSSITNTTDIVITPDVAEKSSKIDKAKSKGIKIMKETEFYGILKKNRAYLEENGYKVPK